jgi:molybdopterin/thiamine biosynthesis adenylyltransferase
MAVCQNSHAMNSINNPLRYSRQTTLPSIGTAGQLQLQNSSVLIIGAGGLGAPASMYLASSGIGQILINDFDTVDITNLPRQVYYRDADTGSLKAQVAAERLREINPATDVIALDQRLDKEALSEYIESVDAVLDCSDNFATRWTINEICHAQRKAFVSGAAIRWEGQLTVFRFDQQQTPCYRCLYNEDDENLHNCAGQGILAPIAGTVGTMMATETIKLLLGIDTHLAGSLWVYDGMAGISRNIKISSRTNCSVCSK